MGRVFAKKSYFYLQAKNLSAPFTLKTSEIVRFQFGNNV